MTKIANFGSAALAAFSRFRTDERGATAIEYAMIASGLSIAIAATVFTLGDGVKNLFTSVSGLFP